MDVTRVRARREEAAVAVFGTWMIIGLFIDGWAHQADKPETFFSPWHGILYSGFVAAIIWFAIEGVRQRGRPSAPTSPLITVGLVLFIVGAVGDGIWHEIFGIEVDLEALLSPTHLLLLIGGFLMVTEPLRSAFADAGERAPALRQFAPQVVTLTLAVALVGFFTMYLSVFDGIGREDWEDGHALAVGSVLLTTLLVMASTLWVLKRWLPPAGTFTILFGGMAALMTVLEGFRLLELALPFLLAGLVADALVRGGAGPRWVAAVVPVVLWGGYFLTAHLSYGVTWSPELWLGAIVLPTAGSLLLQAMMAPAGVSGDVPGQRDSDSASSAVSTR